MADIFVSYTSKDRDWAFWIGQQLEKLGHVVHLDAWEISAGGNIADWIQQRTDEADHIVLVISAAYLGNPYSSWERRAAQWAGQSKQPNYAIPIRIEDCELPPLLDTVARCDLFGIDESEARARLTAFMAPATKPVHSVSFPGNTASSVRSVPHQTFPGHVETHSSTAAARTVQNVATEKRTDSAGGATSAVPKHATAPFYSDHAARRDLLNRKAVAETIATMVTSVWKDDDKERDIDRTFMVHLHGRWGSGKTSILNFLRDELRKNSQWVVVDYNAWRNQSLGPAWWTLMETVYRQALIQLRGWQYFRRLRLICGDRWWRLRSSYAPFTFAATLSVVIALLLIWTWRTSLIPDTKGWFEEGLKIVGSIVGLAVSIFAFGSSYRVGSAQTAKSYVELSRDPLSPLVRRYRHLIGAIGAPVAVFIDDLDRCNAEFVVELLQTVQTLFRDARVFYMVAADRDWVCASYQQQYKVFGETMGEPGKSLGHLFLEKVFQLSVEVPRLSENERNQYWEELINAQTPATTEPTKEQIDQVRREVRRATTEPELLALANRYQDDPQLGGIAVSQIFQQMQSTPLQREREHFLSGYSQLIEANPRAMKRLLNAYGFRRGFDILSRRRSDPDALVRWTILENRWPVLADYLEGRSRGSAIIDALVKDKAVLEVSKGLTWENIRDVTSAPDQPPVPEITPSVATKT